MSLWYPHPMTPKAKPVLIVVGAILIALFPISRWIAWAYLLNAPREYFSAVTVEIKPDTFNRDTGTGGSAIMSGRTDPQFLAIQFLMIKSPIILNPVIAKLDLVKKLSPPGKTMPKQWVTETLSRSIVVQEQKNTNLIEIGVYHADKQLASDIANTIAVTYRDQRIEDIRREPDQTLAEMKDELQTKRVEVAKLFQEVSQIRQEDKIVDLDPESISAVLSITGTVAFEKRALVDQLCGHLARIAQLKPEEWTGVLRMLNFSDQTVEKTLPLLLDTKAEEVKLLSEGFGENDPRLKSLRAQGEIYTKILNDQIESIKKSLKTKLGIGETTLKPNEEQIDEKVRLNRYVEKKSAYVMGKQLLNRTEQIYQAARFDNMPSVNPVKIWDRAVPGLYPARPDVAATLLRVNAIGGPLAGIGVLLILVALLMKSPRVQANANAGTSASKD